MGKHGVPSNNLAETGLIIHSFDGTENFAQAGTWKGWFPCTSGFCENAAKWWSGSIINTDLRNSFGGAALIMSPSENALMCSYNSDAGTLTAGCANQGGGYFGPNETWGMMLGHMRRKGYGYNEVLIDMEVYVKNLPKSVAGIVYGLREGLLERDEARAHQVYVRMLDRYNLTEASFPLLKANYDPSSDEPIHGRAFIDMSAGARAFLTRQKPLEENPLKQEDALKQEEWDKAHPDLKDHPEACTGGCGSATRSISVNGGTPRGTLSTTGLRGTMGRRNCGFPQPLEKNARSVFNSYIYTYVCPCGGIL